MNELCYIYCVNDKEVVLNIKELAGWRFDFPAKVACAQSSPQTTSGVNSETPQLNTQHTM